MESHTESDNSNKEDILNETQSASLSESQDFHLVVTESDDFSSRSEDDTQKTKPQETVKDNDQKPVIQSDLRESSDTPQFKIDDNSINIKDKKDSENEKAIKKVIEDNSSVHDLENKDEFPDNDEDEVIEGTPPHLYSSPKSSKKPIIATLKRKAAFSDERPAKLVKTSIETMLSINEQFVREDSPLSCKSDDSYEELPKNSGKNIIIEETQDLQVNEFSQDSSNNLAKDADAIENSSIQDNSFKQQNKAFPDKSCDMNENENLNISMKVAETSTNDSIITINSLHESNIQIEGNNLSMETKQNVTSSSAIIIVDEKSETDIPNTTNESLQSKDIDTASNENYKVQTNSAENKKITGTDPKYHEQEISSQMKTYDEDGSKNTGLCKSRMSVEVIYDRTEKTAVCESKSKPELVVIDEEGEKVILDSLDEDSKNIKDSLNSRSDKLTNSSNESKKSDTASIESDIFSNIDIPPALERGNNNPTNFIHSTKGFNIKGNSFVSKDLDNIDLINISDNENDTSNMEDNMKNKSDSTHNSVLAKAMQIEKEIGVYVRLKCLLHVDENTKEFLSKELTAVHCESNMDISSRQKNEDASSSLADISDNNKEASPGSVNSNPQLYHLNPSRLSVLSMISTSSSASSAASLAAKLALKDSMHFSLPRGPVKHAKKVVQDSTTPIKDKQTLDESYNRLIHEWKNNSLLTTTVLSCINAELGAVDTYNINNEKLNDHNLQKVRSSTPEIPAKSSLESVTPKSTKKRILKRPKIKTTKLNVQNNREENVNILQTLDSTQNDNTPSRKKSKIETEENQLLVSNIDVTNSSPPNELIGELINKEVFAKWSDNNYYPGVVVDKVKTKYKIKFYDGKSKVLIPEFIIPIPKTLREGLSVYATTKVDDYGSCGIIVDIQTTGNDIYYMVETDEGKRLQVQIKNIFLSSDQAQLLKEEINSVNNETFPTTPKHLGQVTLDNMVEGKRRSKRTATPIFSSSTSKSSTRSSNLDASVSGVSVKLKRKRNTLSESEGISSDSNISVKDENINGMQSEIIGTPYEQTVKGPLSKIKGKPRSKRKVEDEQTIIRLGPIPQANSNIFKGMHFLLACVSLDDLDKLHKYQVSASETESESEEMNWIETPFVRDRLETQIIEGGGKVYTDFDQIPKDQYQNTKLITNVPNTTAKSILCLSVGIRAYNHKWIIRCCLEGKIVSPVEDVLPIGWSLEKARYIEGYQEIVGKPLKKTLIIIPSAAFDREFTTFWRKVCENAEAIVLEAENAGVMETLDFGKDIKIVVVCNRRCPSWTVKKATELHIPLLSTAWVIQCLIEGERCDENEHPRYRYNYI